ncbi:uncharacterized protein TNCV_5110481 [Trichonephila clavipes]|nr:uncharacterized protein TNCV_5110481 [Trichonephila clavipes]
MASKDDRKKLKRGFVEEEEEYPKVSPKKSVKKGKPQNIFDLDLSPPSSGSHEDEDYDFALLVFRAFKCKKFADYLQLYQQLDVILLAEVFTSFRQKCLQFYKLDPCHFITAADLTWNAGLKYTKVELELFSDINMYLWIENSIRGGICFVGKRYALANNPFIPGFNKHEEESYIIAVDANNLYGYAMSQPLPIGHFFWLTKDELALYQEADLGEYITFMMNFRTNLNSLSEVIELETICAMIIIDLLIQALPDHESHDIPCFEPYSYFEPADLDSDYIEQEAAKGKGTFIQALWT